MSQKRYTVKFSCRARRWDLRTSTHISVSEKMKPDPRASTTSHGSLISSLSVDYRKLYNNGFTLIQGHAFNGTKLDAV